MAKKTMKKAAPKKAAKIEPAKDKPRTKGSLFGTIAEHTELSRKQVAAVGNTIDAAQVRTRAVARKTERPNTKRLKKTRPAKAASKRRSTKRTRR